MLLRFAVFSMMALGLDPRFDLTHAYILINGIAGVDPKIASLGSAAWADYALDARVMLERNGKRSLAPFGAERDGLSGRLKTLSRNTEAGFDLLRMAICEPRFDVSAIDRVLVNGALSDAEGRQATDPAYVEEIRRWSQRPGRDDGSGGGCADRPQ